MIEKNIDNFNYQKLSPFKWFVLNNFPFLDADFDAMTEWQLFQKLGSYINKVIDSQNYVGSEMEKVINAYNELYNYVDNYFKNLDLQEEVNNKLNEMAQDGTLAQIINEEIFSDLNEKINNNTDNINNIKTELEKNLDSFELDARRIFRILNENKKYTTPETETFTPYQMQGNCYCGDEKIAYCLLDQARFQDQKCLLVVCDFYGNAIRSKEISNTGHCNNLCFNPDKNELYLTKSDTFDVIVIDYNSLNIKTTKNFSNIIDDGGTFPGLSYDIITKKYYVTSREHIYEVDFETRTLIKKYTVNWNSNYFGRIIYDYTMQNWCIHNNVFYALCMEPNSLACFKIDNDNLIPFKYYNFKQQFNNLFLSREIEQISFLYDKKEYDILIGSTGEVANNSEYQIQQFFMTNLKENYGTGIPNFRQIVRRTLQVDINSASYNPTGTSDNPFKIIDEAFDVLYNQQFSHLILNVSPGHYPFFECNFPGKIIYIKSDNYENVFVNCCSLMGGKITLNRISIESNYNRNHLVYINKCDVVLSNVNFIYTDNNTKKLLYITEFGKCLYGTLRKNGNTFNTSKYYDVEIDGGFLIPININLSSHLLPTASASSKCDWFKVIRNINVAYGNISSNKNIYDCITSGFISKMRIHYTCSGTDQGYIKEFIAPTPGNDSYYITETKLDSNTCVIFEATLNFNDGVISISNNRRITINLSDSSISKQEITNPSATNSIQIKDIEICT